ncbi:hypothetical protein [Actinomadura fibrosa]|uniref:CU044_5270 family protein n=1 Tax=Actinomadura fibrosa TaxID=111802 RepID=A0ABW2Y0I5_9ACTN|nr:hypothetical protein [Actinomadura fibrosa]
MNGMETNEMERVRGLLREPPPPSAEVTAKALGMLEDAMGPGRKHRPRRVPRTGFRHWTRPAMLVPALVTATAVTAASYVALRGNETSDTPQLSREQIQAESVAARTLLLDAAAAVRKQRPVPPGGWWRQRVIDGQAYHASGRGAGYTIYMEVDNDSWQSRTTRDYRFFKTPRPVGPRTPADTTAWRAAGSPLRWQVEADGDKVELTRDNRKPPQYEGSSYVRMPNRDDGTSADVASRIRAGKDPAAFVAAMKRDPGFVEGSAQMLMTGSRYLGDKLASPAARAAVFRTLADLRGIRSVGNVKDASGRTGVALATPWITRVDGTVVEYQLVLDRRTFDILGDQMIVKKEGKDHIPVGALFSYGYTVQENWTNAAPPAR